MTLPEDLIKIRDELAEEHKLLTKDNGIESSNYHFKVGFNACAEIFLKREGPETGFQQQHEAYRYREIHPAVLHMGGWANFRHWTLTHSFNYFETCKKLQSRIEKLVEALEWYANGGGMTYPTCKIADPRDAVHAIEIMMEISTKTAREALAADKEQE